MLRFIMKSINFYKKIRSEKNLFLSWNHIEQTGKQSKCEKTTKKIKAFSKNHWTKINKIQKQLKDRKFSFSNNQPQLIKKNNKKFRPIVGLPIETRIVHRAILNVLQNEKFIKHHL